MTLRVRAFPSVPTGMHESQSQSQESWHSQGDHTQIRRFMISRLQRLHPALQSRRPSDVTPISSSQLVQRIELMLFKSAYSLEEYMNVCSLERRVHALVTQFNSGVFQNVSPLATHKRVGSKRVCPASTTLDYNSLNTPTEDNLVKRWSSLTSPFAQSPRKKTRKSAEFQPRILNQAIDVSMQKECVETTAVPSFLITNVDLVGNVLSYLSGDEIWRYRSLNRFFFNHAPSMISSLIIDAGKEQCRSLQQHFKSLLVQCSNVKTLVIRNSHNDGHKTGFSRILPLTDSPRSSAQSGTQKPTHLIGSALVTELASALSSNALLKLESLELIAPFDCAAEGDATVMCLSALAKNLDRSPSLKHLKLESNILGDERLCVIAHLLEAPCFRNIHSLMLRNNFMGEASSHALWTLLFNSARSSQTEDTLAHRLQMLDLGRNILTDGAILRLAALMKLDRRVMPHLENLQLEENFIGSLGFQGIARVLSGRNGALVRSGTQVFVGCEKNCVPVEHVREILN